MIEVQEVVDEEIVDSEAVEWSGSGKASKKSFLQSAEPWLTILYVLALWACAVCVIAKALVAQL